MKKILKCLITITIVVMLAIGLTGCGKEESTGNGGLTGGDNNTNGLYSIKDSDISVDDGFDISMVPSVIKKGVGKTQKFDVTSPSPADEYKTTIRYGFKVETSELENAKTSLMDHYTSNGGSKTEKGSTETMFTFDWGNIVVSVYSSTGSIDCVANVNK